MKKVTSILISIVLLTGMLMSSASATATIYYPTKSTLIAPCQVTFIFKKGCYRTNLSASNFPELPVVRYEGRVIGTSCCSGTIEYDRNARIPVEEAMKRLAENSMVEEVYANEYGQIETSPRYMGDVNCDRALNAKDVTLMMEYMLGRAELSENGSKAVDVNGDGWVNAKDITQVMRWILEG